MVDIRMPDGRIVRLPGGAAGQHVRRFATRGRLPGAGGTAAPPQARSSPGPKSFAVADRTGGGDSERPAPGGRTPADLASRLAAFGAAFEDAMLPPVPYDGSFPGGRRRNGNALADVLNNPTVADMLLKRRLDFLG